jgi:hypothetical protein
MVAAAEARFAIDPATVFITAVLNAVIAIPIAAVFGAVERRFGSGERVDW